MWLPDYNKLKNKENFLKWTSLCLSYHENDFKTNTVRAPLHFFPLVSSFDAGIFCEEEVLFIPEGNIHSYEYTEGFKFL